MLEAFNIDARVEVYLYNAHLVPGDTVLIVAVVPVKSLPLSVNIVVGNANLRSSIIECIFADTIFFILVAQGCPSGFEDLKLRLVSSNVLCEKALSLGYAKVSIIVRVILVAHDIGLVHSDGHYLRESIVALCH